MRVNSEIRSYRKETQESDTKALIEEGRACKHPSDKERSKVVLIQKRAFVLVTVYSDADRSSLSAIREIASVKNVDMVLGAFDAIVTVEGEDENAIEAAVANISRTRGVKEAKPLVEVQVGSHGGLKPVIGRVQRS